MTYQARLDIREFYRERIQLCGGIEFLKLAPRCFPWLNQLTPIENEALDEIESTQLCMFPQFPVGKRWVDFGNPRIRVAIECDGKNWHNPNKDALRDAELSRLGWKVYHVTGAECFETSPARGICRIVNQIIEKHGDGWPYPTCPASSGPVPESVWLRETISEIKSRRKFKSL